MNLEIWIDPACPFCWRTSRWLLDVASQRDLDIHWRTISLLELNHPEPGSDRHDALVATHRMLRVMARLLEGGEAGNEAVGRFYSEVGAQIHHDGVEPADVDIAAVLKALGLDPAIAGAADDKSLDESIRASMEEGLTLAGRDVGTPILAFDGQAGYFGPVVDPVPTGAAAARVFDAVHTLATTPGMWELKRSRDGAPLHDLRRPRTVIPAA